MGDRKAGLAREVGDRVLLAGAELEDCHAVGCEQPVERRQETAIGGEAVMAAIEGAVRLEARDLGHQAVDVAGRDVGGVGEDEVRAKTEADFKVGALT